MAAGVPSLVDYVGYPVGMRPAAALCGYSGVLDWTMLGCGLIGGGPPPGTDDGGSWRGKPTKDKDFCERDRNKCDDILLAAAWLLRG